MLQKASFSGLFGSSHQFVISQIFRGPSLQELIYEGFEKFLEGLKMDTKLRLWNFDHENCAVQPT